MQEATTQTNALIREEIDPATTKDKEKVAVVYDAGAKNRFDYEVKADGMLYDIAHIFGPLSDERYVQWLQEFKVSGNEHEVTEESREASCRLWDDVIVELDNVEYDPTGDWKELVPNQEKIDSLNQLLAVAIADPEQKATAKLSRTAAVEATQMVLTECWFNGDVVKQRHRLRPTSFELEKKYSRIQAKRFKQEKVGGSLKRKPKISYVPQDESLGELYDEMMISVEGFKNDVIPLRFKTTVIHEVFATKLDPKKSQPQ